MAALLVRPMQSSIPADLVSVRTGTTIIRTNVVDALINCANLEIQVEVGALAV